MELVPAGSFSMGYGNTDIADQDTGETTVHTVNISAFYMDKYDNYWRLNLIFKVHDFINKVSNISIDNLRN